MFDIILPKRPNNDRWKQVSLPPSFPRLFTCEAWVHPEGYTVLSAVEAPKEGPTKAHVQAEFHVSISKNKARCSSEEALWVLHEFGIPEAEEDNHGGGFTRNYWRPVADTLVGKPCPCKAEETAIVEDKGDYVWRA